METDSKIQPDVSMETGTVEHDVTMETDANDAQKDSTTINKMVHVEKPVPVATGLPQSKEELESLISAIHQTVNESVLPRLHKCLTAKVHKIHAVTF